VIYKLGIDASLGMRVPSVGSQIFDRATMCAFEGKQHGNLSWVSSSLYGRGPMVRDSKVGCFF
jgi:hypothetical protein